MKLFQLPKYFFDKSPKDIIRMSIYINIYLIKFIFIEMKGLKI